MAELVERIVKRNFCHTELEAAALRALLSHPELAHRWTVAAYICDYRTGWTCEHLKVDDAVRYGMHQLQYWPGQREGQTPKEARLLSVTQGLDADARRFVRAGFKELEYKDGGWLYMTRSMLRKPVLTHTEALGVPLRVAVVAAEEEDRVKVQRYALLGLLAAGRLVDKPAQIIKDMIAGMDRQEREKDSQVRSLVLVGYDAESPKVRSQSHIRALPQIDELVSAGADLNRACALHCCAAKGVVDLFRPLVDRGADINALDPQG